ncbi:MAG: hypothetical protein AAF696_36480 [Bacteroidota bacterium]
MNLDNFFSILTSGHVVVALVTMACLLVIAILEIRASSTEDGTDNLNFIMFEWSRKYYFLSFAWGVIGGHLYFGSQNIYISNNHSLIVISIITLALLLIDFVKKHPPLTNSQRIATLGVGVMMGHFVWTMNGIAN